MTTGEKKAWLEEHGHLWTDPNSNDGLTGAWHSYGDKSIHSSSSDPIVDLFEWVYNQLLILTDTTTGWEDIK